MGFRTDEQYERFLVLLPSAEWEMVVNNGIILRKSFLISARTSRGAGSSATASGLRLQAHSVRYRFLALAPLSQPSVAGA